MNTFGSAHIQRLRTKYATDGEVNEGLAKLAMTSRSATKAKPNAIKSQIAHRKKVLEQKFPPSCGHFSRNNVAFSLEEMVAKLKFIIKLS